MAVDRDVAVALLAAGRSQRFGGDKLNADLGGKPLWRWAASAAEQAGFTTRILITSAGRESFSDPQGWDLAINPDAAEGIASSIRAAVAACPCARLVIQLADMPFVTPQHLIALAASERPTFTAYPQDRPGVPAAFPASAFPRLLRLRDNQGAGSLDWAGAPQLIPPGSERELIDVDTPEGLRQAELALPG